MTTMTTTPIATTAAGTTRSHVLSDSATMLRRNLLHQRRYPVLTFMVIGMPIVFLLLFVYVFGATMGAGIGGLTGGRAEYLTYVVPGIVIMAAAAAAQGTAINVAMDMTEGIVARFRTMAISRAAVLTGHVVGSVLQTMFGIVVVIGLAVALGFRPSAGPAEWAAVFGLLVLVALALIWFSTALGIVSGTVEAASNLPMPLMLLPFLSSGFVPTESMPAGVAWFAEHQPFTPIIETLRNLLAGGPAGDQAVIAVAWCVGIALVGYLWARASYERRSVTS
jgi:ABC-2 type transport system permease protein